MTLAELHRRLGRGDLEGVRALLAGLEQRAARKLVNTAQGWGGPALVAAAANPRCGTDMLALLIAFGAEPARITNAAVPCNPLGAAFGGGSLAKAQFLVEAGADLHYSREGYTAAIDVVHSRDVLRDAGLLAQLAWLVAQKADLNAITRYGESALRVLSRIGRFDAIRLLLDAGADASQLEFTSLHHAVAFGSLEDVSVLLAGVPDLEARDFWSRTPLLLAAQVGDLAKIEVLLARGADFHAVGRCAKPLLFYPIEMHRADVLRALIARGADIEQADQFGSAPLMTAAEADDAEAIATLLAAGAKLDHAKDGQTALSFAAGRASARRLLEAGADPAFLTREGKRMLLGLPGDADTSALDCSTDDYLAAGTRSFGQRNGEDITHPYYVAMIRSGLNAYAARQALAPEGEKRNVCGSGEEPTWCAERFGQSLTFLPDGRVVQIAGEHEDSYDPDFCIYNDVFVHHPDGRIQVFGYPRDVFPPTDFHTATLVGDFIYIVGNLGYQEARRPGTTPVYRLALRTMEIQALATSGPAPSWIHRHRADLLQGGTEILVSAGTVIVGDGEDASYEPNTERFVLDLRSGAWQRLGSAVQ